MEWSWVTDDLHFCLTPFITLISWYVEQALFIATLDLLVHFKGTYVIAKHMVPETETGCGVDVLYCRGHEVRAIIPVA